MVNRYVKNGADIAKLVSGTDFIWMATYLGEVGYYVHSSSINSNEFLFARDGNDNTIFKLELYKMFKDEPLGNDKVRLSHQYACTVYIDDDAIDFFNTSPKGYRESASAWFYDNEWPVYLDGEPDPSYDWMDDVKTVD